MSLRSCVHQHGALRAAIRLLALLIALAGAVGAKASANVAVANDPMSVVKIGVTDVLTVFRNTRMPLQERRAKLRALAARYFDFEDMARSALGYHWRDLTPEQRAEFVPIFSDFIENAYLSKLQESGVKRIQQEVNTANIQYTKQSIDGDYAQVSTAVSLQDQKEPIEIDYLMHRADGQWRIYDVTVAAISVIGNYRNQFNRVINNEGYDRLVAALKAKTQQLQEYMEHPPPQ